MLLLLLFIPPFRQVLPQDSVTDELVRWRPRGLRGGAQHRQIEDDVASLHSNRGGRRPSAADELPAGDVGAAGLRDHEAGSAADHAVAARAAREAKALARQQASLADDASFIASRSASMVGDDGSVGCNGIPNQAYAKAAALAAASNYAMYDSGPGVVPGQCLAAAFAKFANMKTPRLLASLKDLVKFELRVLDRRIRPEVTALPPADVPSPAMISAVANEACLHDYVVDLQEVLTNLNASPQTVLGRNLPVQLLATLLGFNIVCLKITKNAELAIGANIGPPAAPTGVVAEPLALVEVQINTILEDFEVTDVVTPHAAAQTLFGSHNTLYLIVINQHWLFFEKLGTTRAEAISRRPPNMRSLDGAVVKGVQRLEVACAAFVPVPLVSQASKETLSLWRNFASNAIAGVPPTPVTGPQVVNVTPPLAVPNDESARNCIALHFSCANLVGVAVNLSTPNPMHGLPPIEGGAPGVGTLDDDAPGQGTEAAAHADADPPPPLPPHQLPPPPGTRGQHHRRSGGRGAASAHANGRGRERGQARVAFETTHTTRPLNASFADAEARGVAAAAAPPALGQLHRLGGRRQ